MRNAPSPLLLFAGKGGVGKTTLATAHALRAADDGARTLLVSTDPAHSTADVLETPLNAKPAMVQGGLWAVELDPEAEARRYVDGVRNNIAGITPPGMTAEVERQLAMARETPGVVEAAVLQRLAALVAEIGPRWDRLVVDTAPFGHTLRLLALPDTLGAWLDAVIGRRRTLGGLERMWRDIRGAAPATDPILDALEARRSVIDALRRTLADPTRTAVILVAVPERLSLRETERSAARLRHAGITPTAVVLNRVREGNRAACESFRAAFPDLPMREVPEAPDHVRDGDLLRYIGARLEALA